MKKILGLMLVCLLLTGCGPQTSSNAITPPPEAATSAAARIGVVFGVGGMKDGAYNETCLAGFERAKQELEVPITYIETVKEADYEANVQQLIEEGHELIVCLGYSMADIITEVAEKNPDIRFVITDAVPRTDLNNLCCIMFAQEQGAYLAGVVAAATTQHQIVGLVLGNAGANNERMNSFAYGYIAGVLDTDPAIQILQYNTNSFADLPGGKSAALAMAAGGADVVFHAAGGTGTGVIEGCAEAGIWAIGVDTNQRALAPEHVIASSIKKTDSACYHIVQDFLNDVWTPGIVEYDIQNGDVDILTVKENISPKALKRAEEARQALKNGTITIPATEEAFVARYGNVYELG